jgi:hypothetical protein
LQCPNGTSTKLDPVGTSGYPAATHQTSCTDVRVASAFQTSGCDFLAEKVERRILTEGERLLTFGFGDSVHLAIIPPKPHCSCQHLMEPAQL